MRIVQMIDTLGWGGAQNMMMSLCSSLRDQKNDVTVICLGKEDAPFAEQLREQDISFICLPGKHLFDPSRFLRLVRELRRGNFELVQTYLSYANILGSVAGRLVGVPVVISLRNAVIDRRHYNPLRFRLEGWALRYWAQRIVVNGYSIADAHRERAGNTPIHIIPNTVPVLDLLSEDKRASVRSGLIGDTTGIIVISVGRLSPPKGYPDLITAFAKKSQHFPGAFLIIVGNGEMRAQLSKQIENLGMSERILLLGARTDVLQLLMASDIYISASHGEGMSVALLESMSAGLPVIATTVGDAPRMVVDGTGLLVEPGKPDDLADALASLLDDPSRCKLMGKKARMHVIAHYDRSAWSKAFIDLYTEVIGLS